MMAGQRLASTFFFGAVALGQASEPVLDGIELPRVTQVTYKFQCEELSATFGYVQERLPLGGDVTPYNALAVRLFDFTVAGERPPPTSFAKVEAQLAQLGWVERAEARCYGGDVYFTVHGMPRRAWADFITEKTKTRPKALPLTIIVSPDGAVTTQL